MNKGTIAGLLTGAPIITCALMGLFFLHNIFNKSTVVFGQITAIILCFVFFLSATMPFIFGKMYAIYNEQNKKE